MTQELRWSNALQLTWPRLGLFSMMPLERFLIEKLGDLTFADLQTPLAVVSADLVTGEQVVLREGRLAPALRASCSLPGLFQRRKSTGACWSTARVQQPADTGAPGRDVVIATTRARAPATARATRSAFSSMARWCNAADDLIWPTCTFARRWMHRGSACPSPAARRASSAAVSASQDTRRAVVAGLLATEAQKHRETQRVPIFLLQRPRPRSENK
jgi:hypothetical protein